MFRKDLKPEEFENIRFGFFEKVVILELLAMESVILCTFKVLVCVGESLLNKLKIFALLFILWNISRNCLFKAA